MFIKHGNMAKQQENEDWDVIVRLCTYCMLMDVDGSQILPFRDKLDKSGYKMWQCRVSVVFTRQSPKSSDSSAFPSSQVFPDFPKPFQALRQFKENQRTQVFPSHCSSFSSTFHGLWFFRPLRSLVYKLYSWKKIRSCQ